MNTDFKSWNSTLRPISKKRMAQIESGEYKPKKQKPIKQVSDKQRKEWEKCRSATIKFYSGKSVLSGKPATIVHHWEETRTQNPSRKYDLSNLVLLTEEEHRHTGADIRFYQIKGQIEYKLEKGLIKLQEKTK
jgi:hypothetical protein